MLKIYTLGPVKLMHNGAELQGLTSQKKSEALLIYLANQPSAHSREALANLFWSDYPEARALNNLSVLLSTIRKHLGDVLISNRQSVQFNPEAELWLDTKVFLKHIDNFHKADNQPFDLLSEAVELYQGDFLNDFYLSDAKEFEIWQNLERNRFQQLTLESLNTLLNNYHIQANYPEGIKLAYKTLELDPINEQVNYQLIHMLALKGDKRDALNHFKNYCALLEQDLGIEPEDELKQLITNIKEDKLEADIPSHKVYEQKINFNTDQSAMLARLEPLQNQVLFGAEQAIQHLNQALKSQSHPYLIALYGMGGLGKTTLANQLSRNVITQALPNHFEDFAWVSAKQEEFLFSDGITGTGKPALDRATLVNNLLDQLSEVSLTATAEQKEQSLKQILKSKAHLIVVDNLESSIDIQEIIPLLRELSKPTKVLITSRFALRNHSDVYGYNLSELIQEDSFALLRHEASKQSQHPLQQAADKHLEQIHQVVGGNPLALKLVAGQLSFLPLQEVLTNLQEAQGKKVEALYSYMYWQAWNMLSDNEKQLFLTMPAMKSGTFKQLSIASMLDTDDLQAALERLITLSLVQVAGDIEKTRYRLHRLTETFLMREVMKWQA